MLMLNTMGTAFVFDRADIDTDLIIPARYLNTSEIAELAPHALEPLGNTGLVEAKSPIIVAGANFGCGSSREHAVWALSGVGVQVVIAESFARIFFRNSINFGLLPIVLSGAAKKIDQGDELEIVTGQNIIQNITKNEEYEYESLPEFLQEIVNAGGLLLTLKV